MSVVSPAPACVGVGGGSDGRGHGYGRRLVMSVRGDATAARYGFHIERSPFGGFTLYEARGAGYVSRYFMFYTVREACQMWRRELRGGAA